MRNIIIVEAMSTGFNLIEDVTRRGYNPVVLEGERDADFLVHARQSAYAHYLRKPEIIKASVNYEETIALVKKYDPLLVIPGCEAGVVLATRLADDLGLPGNPYANIAMMTKKDAMQDALKKAGIRYIHGEVVDDPEKAVAFCRENNITLAIVKPLQSLGSQGLFLCDDLNDVKNAVSTLLTMKDVYGRPIEAAIVQERIIGTEYIVNTVSCNGVHRLNSILRYAKERTPEGGYIYDYCESVNVLEPGHSELVSYAYQVADAIGFRYGVIHGEFMIDAKGPVLIEVNCRPMGGAMDDAFLDGIFGQHESDTMLDSYLNPESMLTDKEKTYHPLRKGILKFIMTPKDMEVEDHPICVIAKQLKSVHRIDTQNGLKPVYYKKTRDLVKPGGRVIIPQSTYRYLSYQKEGAELLMRIKHLNIEAPLPGLGDQMIGTNL